MSSYLATHKLKNSKGHKQYKIEQRGNLKLNTIIDQARSEFGGHEA